MEQRLIGKPVAKRPKSKTDEKLVDLIAALMPADRAVTNDDVCGLLRAADPGRQFNAPTIRATLHRLVTEGTIKKISNPQHGQKVQYCLPDFEAEPVRPLADWAEQILSESSEPLTATEIMVRMTEQGYVMKAAPADAVPHLAQAIMKDRKRFLIDDGKWSLR